MRHALSFDVECFHQYNLRDFLGRSQAPTREVERNVHWILDRLAERSVHATFFVLGNVARASREAPPLVAIGMNPSHAAQTRADRTVNRLIEAGVRHG